MDYAVAVPLKRKARGIIRFVVRPEEPTLVWDSIRLQQGIGLGDPTGKRLHEQIVLVGSG